MLSQPDGTWKNASSNIEGQENGGLPEGFTFGHEMSSGDFDGDGDIDFFTGKLLFINDGTGRFTNESQLLPQVMRPTGTYLMTSLIGDLDGDGKGDVVSAYAEAAGKSGYVYFTGNNSTVELPEGRFGINNTKFNSGMLYDVNLDGKKDIVFSVTRSQPYYRGRLLQVFLNNGNRTFQDATQNLVISYPLMDQVDGEGHMLVVDVNADNVPDLIHSGAGPFDTTPFHSVTVYLNINGKLIQMDPTAFPWVSPWQLSGFEGLRQWQESGGMQRAYPIDLDKQAGIDFVSFVRTPLSSWPQNEPSKQTYYSILSKQIYVSSSNGELIKFEESSLDQNFPNPFSTETTIHFRKHSSGTIRLSVCDLQGREVALLLHETMPEGSHSINFNAAGLTPGMYFYRLETAEGIETRRMWVIKE
jgi:hypothetical protein